MNAGVLARLLATVKREADAAQFYDTHVALSLLAAREVEAALEEALEAATKREDEERFAKENAEIVNTRIDHVEERIEGVEEALQDAIEKLRDAVGRLEEAVNS